MRTRRKKKPNAKGKPNKDVFDDPQVLIDAIEKHNGILHFVARELGVTIMTIWKYRKKWPSVEKAYQKAKPFQAKWLAGKLFERAEANSDKALIFLASRKCPDLRPPPQEKIHRHGQDPNALPIQHRHVMLDVSTMPPELKRQLLEHMRKEQTPLLENGNGKEEIRDVQSTGETAGQDRLVVEGLHQFSEEEASR